MPLIHPALRKLHRLKTRAAGRKLVRSLKQPRRAVFVIGGLLWFAMIILPNVSLRLQGETIPTDPEKVIAWTPVIMLFICFMQMVSPSGKRAIAFSPGERHFLFSGPFTRRELLYYKLLANTTAITLMAFMLSFFLIQHISFYPAGLIGLILAQLFVHFFAMIVALSRETWHETWTAPGRRPIGLVILGAFLIWTGIVLSSNLEDGWQAGLFRIRHELPLSLVFRPMEVFGRVFVSTRIYPDLLLWTVPALAILLAMVVIIVRMDANFLVVSDEASEELYKRMQRARQSGGRVAPKARRMGKLKVPRLPWLWGCGPTVYRQLLITLRTSRSLLYMPIIVAVVIGPMFFALKDIEGFAAYTIVVVTAYGTFLLTMMMPLGFRGEINCMDWLKALPLPATRLVAGEMLVPVMLFTTVHLLVIGLVAALPGTPAWLPLIALVFTLPFNIILIGMDQFFFLLFPAQAPSAVSQEFHQIGRNMVMFLLKILSVLALAGLASLAAWIILVITRESWTAFVLTFWLVIVLETVAIVPMVAWAFGRYDVTEDASE